MNPIKENQKPVPKFRRKGALRNQQCICGSGKKYKRCCWPKFNVDKGQDEQ